MFNFVILLGCLIKLFVYGDPVLPAKSKESVAFWRHRRQADFDLSKVHYCPVCSSVNAFLVLTTKDTVPVQGLSSKHTGFYILSTVHLGTIRVNNQLDLLCITKVLTHTVCNSRLYTYFQSDTIYSRI
jgi:hypothetical protein